MITDLQVVECIEMPSNKIEWMGEFYLYSSTDMNGLWSLVMTKFQVSGRRHIVAKWAQDVVTFSKDKNF